MARRIAILGSTGSIGKQTLDVIAHHPDLFAVEALAAGYNTELLIEQIRLFRPKKVSVADKAYAEAIKYQIPTGIKVVYGMEGLLQVAADTQADFVVSALVGSMGLKPTLAAIASGKDIGLANKETLVSAGHIVSSLRERKGVSLIPIDSEHSAIFQCLNGEKISFVNKIILTASGGTFRDKGRDELENVTVEEALRHPNWSMGAKITIDSATMVNKGLEVIEAHWLFALPYSQIEVLIHPQSIVHSMVEFADHSIIAQLGTPDMRIPIQYALTYPQRINTPAAPLNLAEIGQLQFRSVDFERYPCLRMAYDCGKLGGSAPTVFNAANEAAVALFLEGKLKFTQIERIIESVLEKHHVIPDPDLHEIEAVDAWARREAGAAFN